MTQCLYNVTINTHIWPEIKSVNYGHRESEKEFFYATQSLYYHTFMFIECEGKKYNFKNGDILKTLKAK